MRIPAGREMCLKMITQRKEENKMKFRKIELSDRPWIEGLRDTEINSMSVLSFQGIYTWQNMFGLKICGDGEFFVLHSDADQAYYYPCGSRKRCRQFVKEELQAGRRLKFVYVPEQEREFLEKLGFIVMLDRDTSEYVYDTRMMALLDPGASRNYRRKCRNFSKNNVFRTRCITGQELTLLHDHVSEWERMEIDGSQDDIGAVRAALDSFIALSMSGVCLEAETGGWAFMIGYQSTPDIYDMAMVKYSDKLSPDVVPYLISEIARLVSGSCRYINLEDDMGIAGLRTMKTLYKPQFMLDSYTACWSGKGEQG